MRPGEVIHERFVIERFVARGGMGEVYRALDQQTNSLVALKLMAGPGLHAPGDNDDHLGRRFENEARALAELDHPAIVKYIAHGMSPGAGRYLAMEWLEGATLSAVVRKHPLSIEDALRLGARVAEGLAVAHARGLVHRDIKPGNLFLVGEKPEDTKILDFGLVRNPDVVLTATGAGMGTPDYMAPEQARCDKEIGPPADVFALGSVLYRAIAGIPAFRGENVKAILAKLAMLEESPRLHDAMGEVPEVVDDLVAALMEHDPARRPRDGAEAAALIHAARRDLSTRPRRRAATPNPSLGGAEQQPVAVLFVDLERRRRARLTPTDPNAYTVQIPVAGSGEHPGTPPSPLLTPRKAPAARSAGERAPAPPILADGGDVGDDVGTRMALRQPPRGSGGASENGGGSGGASAKGSDGARPGLSGSGAPSAPTGRRASSPGRGPAPALGRTPPPHRGPQAMAARGHTPAPISGRVSAVVSDPRRLEPPSNPALEAPAPDPADQPALAMIRQTAEPIGGRVMPLLDGSVVVMLAGGAQGTDLVTRAGRLALALQALVPRAAVALATRQVVVGDARAASPVIDGAAAMAKSRRIRIDRRTRDLLPEHFQVDGDEADGFALLAERPPELVHHRLLGRALPMVGRQGILGQLRAVVDGAAMDRAAAALVITGDAGVGKSRLRAELLREVTAARRDLTLIMAAGDPLRTGVPGGLVARALRTHLSLPEGPLALRQAALSAKVAQRVEASERQRVADFIGQIIGVAMPTDDNPALRAAFKDPQLMAEHKKRAVADYLAAEAKHQPTLLVVDDLHWTDALSIDLIGGALEAARELPLVVLGFGRPEVAAQFPKLGEKWGRQEVRLEPLRPGASAELVRQALGASVPDATVKLLVERAGGNAFYLEELVRAAASEDPTGLPSSLLVSTQLRLGKLPARSRQVLRAASIFGRSFWVGGVAALLKGEHEEQEILDWLVQHERDELVERQSESRAFPGQAEYLFRHDLLREAVYQMLIPEDRVVGHRLAGEWLQERGEGDAVVLAEHFAGGGVTDQAIDYFELAAKRALEKGAEGDLAALRKAATHYRRAGETCAVAYSHDAAIRYFERAIGIWVPIDLAESARTRLELAQVRARSGARDQALEHLRVAEDEASRASAKPGLKVEILLERAHLELRAGEQGALDKGIRSAEAAIEMAKRSRMPELHARALTALAVGYWRKETPETGQRAVELIRRALTLVEERGQIAEALWRLGNVFLISNDLVQAHRLYRDALRIAEESRDELLQACCHGNMGMLAFRGWRLEDACKETGIALELLRKIGYRTRILETSLNLGAFHSAQGHAQIAKEELTEVLKAASNDWILCTGCLETLSDIDRLAGDESTAQARLREASEIAGRVGATSRQAVYLGLHAESLWAVGAVGPAVRALEESASLSKSMTLSHARILVHLGPVEEAIGLLERFVNAESDPIRRWPALTALARAQCIAGDRSGAIGTCATALGLIDTSPVERFQLPLVALRAALSGDLATAVEAMAICASCCSAAEQAEVAADVGDALRHASHRNPALAWRFLAQTERIAHRGLEYHLRDIRSDLLQREGHIAKSQVEAALANECLALLLSQLRGDYRAALLDHPWTAERPRLRIVPRD